MRRFFRVFSLAALIGAAAPAPALACRLALALTIDVSGSIDPGEYRFQMDGLADALEDPVIAEALSQAQAALMVVQWSGAADQDVSIPWRRMLSYEAVGIFAQQVRATKRRWHGGKTAVGDALDYVIGRFAEVPDCTRRVIDISGDGQSNDGSDTVLKRALARELGITINGVAIDRMGLSVTQFYRNQVITGADAFVMTATGYTDYPRAIRKKLFREVVVPAM